MEKLSLGKSKPIALLFLWSVLGLPVNAQPQTAALDQERERLDREQMAIDGEKKDFNRDCNRVPSNDTAKIRRCTQRQQQILVRLRQYTDDLAAYEKRVRELEPLTPEPGMRDALGPMSASPTDSQQGVWKAIRSSLTSPGKLYAHAKSRFIQALSDQDLRTWLLSLYGQYHSSQLTADDLKSELVAKAALEQARTRAIEDLQADVARLKRLQAMFTRGRLKLEKEPGWREAFKKSDEFLREVEAEAERRMRAGLILQTDEDLSFLFDTNRQIRIWPGPRDPRGPLPNPLANEAQFQKIRELVIWERREQDRVEALFQSHPELVDYLVEDVLQENPVPRQR